MGVKKTKGNKRRRDGIDKIHSCRFSEFGGMEDGSRIIWNYLIN
jgi:hypothetical protein